jgi:signal transduction histidine kinase
MLIGVPGQFTVRTDGSLPVLTTYGAPLEQVLRNLISNAIKHHPGPAGLVEVTAEPVAGGYVFSVRDDGAGVPDEYAERIFEMFQTLEPRDEIEGSGMGLAIVRRIVEWQGGKVWLEASPHGSGAVFKFEWKTDRAEQAPVRTSAA